MSLDVYLTSFSPSGMTSEVRIFIREDGQTREISKEEWNARFPGQAPITVDLGETKELFWGNITHNLGKMAAAADIYEALWRPEELGFTHARQLIEPLEAGLERLETDPKTYKVHSPPNGWGDYDGLVRFVREYLNACQKHPEAEISVSR